MMDEDLLYDMSNYKSRLMPFKPKKPSGLTNFGNTCYINVIIQSLLSLKYFINFINSDLSTQLIFTKKHNVDKGIMETFRHIDNTYTSSLKTVFMEMKNNSGNLRLRKFRDKLKELNEIFDNSIQQDVSEALCFILNCIHEEHSQKVEPYEYETIIPSLKESCDNIFCNEYSPLTPMFQCVCCISQTCLKCLNVKDSYDTLMCIPLDIPVVNIPKEDDYEKYFIISCVFPSLKLLKHERKQLFDGLLPETKEKVDELVMENKIKTKDHDLMSCVANYMEPKIVDDVNCTFCDVHNAKFENKIVIAPKILTFQIKRFTSDRLKLFNPINIIENFNIVVSGVDCRYSLSAVINHSGISITAGHYYSYGRNREESPNDWYMFNDSSTSSCTFDSINKKDVYMLFYELDQ